MRRFVLAFIIVSALFSRSIAFAEIVKLTPESQYVWQPFNLAESQPASQAVVKTADQLKREFVAAFAQRDGDAIGIAYKTLEKNYPDDPGLPEFAFELARLYGYAAWKFPELQIEEKRAQQLWEKFSTGNEFSASPFAEWARLEHGRLLPRIGQSFTAAFVDRDLANNSSDAVFCEMLHDAITKTLLNPAEVEFWKTAMTKRLSNMPSFPPQMIEDVQLLQQWDSEAMKPRRLRIQALYHSSQAQNLLGKGNMQLGMEELNKAEELAQKYLDSVPAGQDPPVRSDWESRYYVQFTMAVAKIWNNDNQGGLDIINQLLQDMPEPPRGKPSIKAIFKHWQIIAEDRIRTIPAAEKERRYYELLAEGNCPSHLICRFVQDLARWSEQRGDMKTAYGFYRDLAAGLPNPGLGLWARKQQMAMEQQHPELSELRNGPGTTLVSVLGNPPALPDISYLPITNAGPRAFPGWREPDYRSPVDVK